MKRDEQKVKEVESKLDGKERGTAYTAEYVGGEVTMKRVGGPDPTLSLADLELNKDLALARYTTAAEQRDHWEYEAKRRSQFLTESIIVFLKKKHNLTDEDLSERWDQNHQGILKIGERVKSSEPNQ